MNTSPPPVSFGLKACLWACFTLLIALPTSAQEADTTDRKPRGLSRVRYGLAVGMHRTDLRFRPSDDYSRYQPGPLLEAYKELESALTDPSTYHPSYNLNVTITAEFPLGKSAWSWRTGLIWQQHGYINYQIRLPPFLHENAIAFYTLQIPIQLRRWWRSDPSAKLRPFAQIGVSPTMSASNRWEANYGVLDSTRVFPIPANATSINLYSGPSLIPVEIAALQVHANAGLGLMWECTDSWGLVWEVNGWYPLRRVPQTYFHYAWQITLGIIY